MDNREKVMKIFKKILSLEILFSYEQKIDPYFLTSSKNFFLVQYKLKFKPGQKTLENSSAMQWFSVINIKIISKISDRGRVRAREPQM